MKNLYTICFLFFVFFSNSQSFFIKTGKNFTNFKFESFEENSRSSIVRLSSDTGTNYEFGVTIPRGKSIDTPYSYEASIILNEFNSVVMFPSESVRYKTEYLGIDNSFLYVLYSKGRVDLEGKLGIGVHRLVFSKQDINNFNYDVREFTEFRGLFLKQIFGIQAKINSSEDVYFTVGYNYLFNFLNINKKSQQELFMNTSQVKLGVYIDF